MTKLIGALFDTQENANRTYQALENSGFAGDEINIFVRKPRESTARKTNVQIQDIALYAVLGAVIVGIIGGVMGLLVGTGILPLPGLEPGLVQLNGLFLFMSITWGLTIGGLTGVILGVAWKLWGSREKAEVMTRQIEKRGVLVTVNVDGSKNEKKAKQVMQEHEALEVGNPAEKWDMEAWTGSDETIPSLKHLSKSR